MEPEKEQSVSFPVSFVDEIFVVVVVFLLIVIFHFGIRWQQRIAEFASGSTSQRSRETVGREESAIVQSGPSGFGQTRRTVETAGAHFAQNEIGTRTTE
jgi:hypothetical protein